MSKLALSVLIDTYNHEHYIAQAVVSAIEQDFPSSDYEIVVVDDGSTDRTPDIVRKFGSRVRLIQKSNGGQASAFNAAFPELRGDIVAFLDGDDWFAAGKLTAVMDALGQHPEAAAVGHGHYVVHEHTSEVEVRVPPQEKFLRLLSAEAAQEARDSWDFVLMGALTARKAALAPVMPLPEVLTFCADGPLSAAALAAGVHLLDRPLFSYRRHQSNLYARGQQSPPGMRRRLDTHELALELTLRTLLRLGVSTECAREIFWPSWVEESRLNLATFGGSRFKTLRTEMRFFHLVCRNPSFGERAFKYGVLGTASLIFPPQQFYRIKDWYTRRELGRFVNRVLGRT